jgi:hypothetical protein
MALRTGARYWTPPQNVIDAGNAARVVYRNAPFRRDVAAQYKSVRRTQLPLQPGTVALRNEIVRQYNVRQTYMPGRSRTMIDSQKLDMHQAGRAIDFMVDKATGDAIANYLVLNADAIGIQYVVWCGNKWNSGARPGARWDAYGGSSGHYDHPHVELSPDGAAGSTPWFQGRSLPSAQESSRLTASAAEAALLDHGEPDAMVLPIVGTITGVAVAAGAAWYFTKGRMA